MASIPEAFPARHEATRDSSRHLHGLDYVPSPHVGDVRDEGKLLPSQQLTDKRVSKLRAFVMQHEHRACVYGAKNSVALHLRCGRTLWLLSHAMPTSFAATSNPKMYIWISEAGWKGGSVTTVSIRTLRGIVGRGVSVGGGRLRAPVYFRCGHFHRRGPQDIHDVIAEHMAIQNPLSEFGLPWRAGSVCR